MEAEKRAAEAALSSFSSALDEVETALRPVLAAIQRLSASADEDGLDAMSRARLHITVCYSANALFCMYLRTQGVDPLTHPVMDEITRVQEAFMRMRKVEAGLEGGVGKTPDRDRRRHIQDAKRSEAKLSAVVFPEEGELLRALYNMKKGKRDRKKEGEHKGDNEESKGEEGSVEGSEGSEPEDEGMLAHVRTTKEDIIELQKLAKKKERKERRKREEKLKKEIKKQKKGKKSRHTG